MQVHPRLEPVCEQHTRTPTRAMWRDTHVHMLVTKLLLGNASLPDRCVNRWHQAGRGCVAVPAIVVSTAADHSVLPNRNPGEQSQAVCGVRRREPWGLGHRQALTARRLRQCQLGSKCPQCASTLQVRLQQQEVRLEHTDAQGPRPK